jgi:Protein of unknown function (DUF3006)
MSNQPTAQHFVVDAIEGTLARLVLYGDDATTFDMPLALLPSDTKEGSHLAVTFALDEQARLQEAAKARELLKELTAGTDPTQTEFQL